MKNPNKNCASSRRPIAMSLCLGSLLALLAVGCGGDAEQSPAEQDDTGTEGDNGSANDLDGTVTNSNSGETTDGSPPVSGALPLDPNADTSGAAGGSMLAPSSLLEDEQCTSGWLRTDLNPEEECAATFGGLCFEDNDAACECAGCGSDACNIAESYPTQISCQSFPLGCNFLGPADQCYSTDEEACQAAGCNVDSCVILESFPAHASCPE